MERKSFVFHASWYAALSKIEDLSVRLELYEAIAAYALFGEVQTLSPAAQIAFSFTRGLIDNDIAKYEKQVARAKMTAQNRTKQHDITQGNTTSHKVVQGRTTSHDIRGDSVSVSVSDSVSDSKKNAPKGAQKKENENENFLAENQGMGNSADSLHSSLSAVDMERASQSLAGQRGERAINATKTAQISTQISQMSNVSAESKISQKRAIFVKPTIEQVQEYCRERGNGIDAAAFWDFYESKGWKVGSNAMKDWQAAVRTWERTEKQRKNNSYYGNKRNIITEPCDFSNEEDIIH